MAFEYVATAGRGQYSPDSRYCGTTSFAFVAAARSVFTVVPKWDDPGQRVFAPLKNNLERHVGALAFRIEQCVTSGIRAPYAVFAEG